MKILYKVEPADPATIHFELTGDQVSMFFGIITFFGLSSQLALIPINLIFGGWLWLKVLAVALIAWALFFLISKLEYDSTYSDRKKIAINLAEIYSRQLNNILDRSKEIVEEMLPYFETAAVENLRIAKIDFSDNALYPFWEKIEEATKFLGCYKEAVDQ